MKEMVIRDESELEPIVEEIVSVLPQKTEAHVIGLSGNLGAGKTSFTKTLAKFLGITEHITSPTFVIMKSYPVMGRDWITKLVHIDAYRVEDIEEMRVLKLEDVYQEEGTILCIEWPENIQELLPKDIYSVSIEINEDGTRTVRYGD